MTYSLGDRQKAYEDAYDFKLIRRLPIIIRVDGSNFHRLTKRLHRPYCSALMSVMAQTALMSAKEIEGCVFAYQQSDEITFVLRNDQSHETEAWFNNRIQKIASITASIVTINFNELILSLDKELDLVGPALFDTRVFAVPSITEVINNLIYRQNDCMRNALSASVLAELTRKYDAKKASKMLQELDMQERLKILLDECDIDFKDYYPLGFRNGIGVYRAPKIVTIPTGQITRQRWTIDDQLPVFSKNHEFLLTILNSGSDIFRAGRDLEDLHND